MYAPPIRPQRTLCVGTLTQAGLLDAFEAQGVRLNALASELLAHRHFRPRAVPLTMTVAPVSVADLGLSQGGNFESIVIAARDRGYGLCPLDAGPYLRLAWQNQAEGFLGQPVTQGCAPAGSVTVASQPLFDDEEDPMGVYLRVIRGVPWLRGYRSWKGHVWAPGDVFAFRVPVGDRGPAQAALAPCRMYSDHHKS